MITNIKVSDAQISALEQTMYDAVRKRIEIDPDVADTVMRIDPNTWLVQIMYIEEASPDNTGRDIPVIRLLERLGTDEDERWLVNADAIYNYAQGYKNLIEIRFCNN